MVNKEWKSSAENLTVDEVLPMWEAIRHRIESSLLATNSLLSSKSKNRNQIRQMLEENLEYRPVEVLEKIFSVGDPCDGCLYLVFSGQKAK